VARISISGLTLEFPIYGSNARSLKNSILSQATGGKIVVGAHDFVTVRAIDNLSLEIGDGERIGITGHNGSGKSTLLRVLAGIYKPTAGKIAIEGRIATLLDPLAGMDFDATGEENIFFRGCLLGMTTREIRSKIDDIEDFTELGDFLRLPLRTYSAGMIARLAFAISTAMTSDILLIDEGIGAGDENFRQKAEQRILQLFDRTSVVLIASHSEEILSHFCNRRIKLSSGKLIEVQDSHPIGSPLSRQT
jgi:ABC-type polysaccharide/polyol phosphate transport system ATPase subunit